jgi:Flp pilus assembly pilin Flp
MLPNFRTLLQKIVYRSEMGQDLAEYATFLGLIAIVVLISLSIIGTGIANVFYAIAAAIKSGVF